MENEISSKAMDKIRETIQTELLKRGFTAQIKHFCQTNDGKHIQFETEPFQTVPVLFKSIQISQFSTSVSVDKEEEEGFNILKVWVQVSARYENFDCGSNGTHLFTLNCNSYKDDAYRFVIR